MQKASKSNCKTQVDKEMDVAVAAPEMDNSWMPFERNKVK